MSLPSAFLRVIFLVRRSGDFRFRERLLLFEIAHQLSAQQLFRRWARMRVAAIGLRIDIFHYSLAVVLKVSR